ncbi:hypothetical protein PFL603g_00180 [Pseudomonas fluorescens]|uniref:Uncharacterized protein n=1 Tax=Pseudomonas fluorescens TaxID=294 RepID=A0A109LAG9_PSEFL|nr:hypothetical protein PFL603g_00180 [Pseudomonas fluorescens]
MQLTGSDQYTCERPQDKRRQYRDKLRVKPRPGPFRQIAAVHQCNQRVHALLDATGKVALTKRRRDLFFNDAMGQQVGDDAFQAVAHFDAHLAVVLGHHQQEAVVDVLAPQFPGAKQLVGVVFDAGAAGGRHQQYGYLRAFALFKVGKLLLEALGGARVESVCQVNDPLIKGNPNGRGVRIRSDQQAGKYQGQ